jgi:hypothetical protein
VKRRKQKEILCGSANQAKEEAANSKMKLIECKQKKKLLLECRKGIWRPQLAKQIEALYTRASTLVSLLFHALKQHKHRS